MISIGGSEPGCFHLVYAQPPGEPLGDSVGKLAAGIDTRGKGYFVAPPSVHASGHRYAWCTPRQDIAACPPWLVDLLRSNRHGDVSATTRSSVPSPSGPRRHAYLTRAAEGELQRVLDAAEGSRNNALNRASFTLGQFVGAGVLDADAVAHALATAARAVGLDELEAVPTIRSGLRAGAQHPRSLASWNDTSPPLADNLARGLLGDTPRRLWAVNGAQGPGESPRMWAEGLDTLPKGYLEPDGYEIRRAGVWHIKPASDRSDEVRTQITSAPLVVTAVYVDPHGEAPVLLDVLGLDSFTVDVSGRSTRGKTTAAKVALSAWASPSERSDGIASWRTTIIAAEKRLNLVRGLPVVLDETRTVKFPELVDQLIYQVPKNHGAARGGGYPSLLPWRTVVISTGEQKLTTFTTHQGANARVLTIASPPFPAGVPDVGAKASRLGEQVALHYGHAGPAFAERVRAALAHDGGADALRSRHKGLSEHFRGQSDMSGRRAPLIGALYLAAQLAHEWEIVPPPVPDLELWQRVLVDDAEGSQEDNRGEQALDVVREYIAAHSNEFWVPKGSRTPPHGGWAGRVYSGKDTGGQETVAVMAHKLRDILHRAGHTLDTVLPSWKESGSCSGSATATARPWRSVTASRACTSSR